MTNYSLLWNPLSAQEQWAVSAYLIAITPHLQKFVKQKRKEEIERLDLAPTIPNHKPDETSHIHQGNPDSSNTVRFELTK